jgi:hypothetical protein
MGHAMQLGLRSSDEKSMWFECGPSLWPVHAARLHINRDACAIRGWFFSAVPVTVYAVGTLVVVGGSVEARVPGLIVVFLEPALDLFRHEISTLAPEAPGSWHPPREPLDLDELKKLWSAASDGSRVQFTPEGGFRCLPHGGRRPR